MLVFVIILAIISAFLQSTLIPTLRIFAGQIDLLLIIILLFLFHNRLRDASIFLLVATIFASFFSGIPLIYQLVPNFFVLVIYVFLEYKRIFFRPGTLLSFPFFLLAVVFSDLSKLLIFAGFGVETLKNLATNAIYSAIVGVIIYYFVNKIYHFLNPQIMRDRIKISQL